MVCAIAPKLQRQAVWDALYDRRCYASTFARILLDFSINDSVMGRIVFVKKGERLTMNVNVNACDTIERIEVISQGKIVRTLAADGMDFQAPRSLGVFDGTPRYYYLRVMQKDGHRAWTSPIWVVPAGTPDLCLERKDLSFDHATGTLTVRPRNYGDTPATAELRVYSSAKNPLLARHRFKGRRGGVAVWVEPIDEGSCMLRVVVASSQKRSDGGEYVCSGTIKLRNVKGYEVALDPRKILKDDGNGTLRFTDTYGQFFKHSQSRSGAVDDMAIRLQTGADSVVELDFKVDGRPVKEFFVGSKRIRPGRPARVRLGGIAQQRLLARRIVTVPANGGSTSVHLAKLSPDVTYQAVLDPAEKIEEVDERNNAALLDVPAEAKTFDPWHDQRQKHK